MTQDSYGRVVDYLRISVTDRCNLRCVYCMPAEGVELKSRESVLSLEEIGAFAKAAAQHGIRRIRLTGGEPLVRLGLPSLVRELNTIEGIDEISLTTNGILLPKYAAELKEAGLKRVNISLDTLDPEVFTRITRGGKLEDVLAAIDASFVIGLGPIKINTVVMRSLNQDIFGFASLSIDRPLHVRFIEYMPVGESAGIDGHGWCEDESVSSDELISIISAQGQTAGIGPLIPVIKDRAPGGAGPARYYRFANGEGTVGFISPLSHHFCGECNRLRLTADGKLRPCLFSDQEFDVKTSLRDHDEATLKRIITTAFEAKPEGHEHKIGTERSMSQIGG